MSVKIFGVSLKDIRLSKDLNVPQGPGFYFNSSRDLSTMYPSIADSASGDIMKVKFNMGQTAFQGDPLGFQPYDTNYDISKWQGIYTIQNGDTVVPDNLDTVIYNKQYNSGKYYYEMTIVDDGYASAAGFAPTTGHHDRLTIDGVGIKSIGTFDSTIQSINAAALWSNAYNIVDNDVVQVYVDFDNDLLCLRKLGTSIEDHTNYITGR